MTLTLQVPIAERDWLEQSAPDINNGAIEHNGATETAENLDLEQWQTIIQEIDGFRKLGDNWDGLRARAPSDELLDSAIGLARIYWGRGLVPPVRVLPGTARTVVFEWQGHVGDYGEVEIDRPFHAEVMLVRPG